MQKPKPLNTLIIASMFFLSACMDFHSEVALFKNDTRGRLLIAAQPFKLMTDSTLYNGLFSKYWVEVNQSDFVSLPNMTLSGQPDSAVVFLYVFNDDSVYRYQTLKKSQGILKHSFIREIEIQLNKVREPLDTIYIR